MKKIFILPMVGLFFMACSVDNEDLDLQESQIDNLNAHSSVEDAEICGTSESHDFDGQGEIVVMNDESNLYITVSSWNGALANTKLHVANDFEDFPTVGQGNLPPGQMQYNKSFEDDEEHYTFTFPLNELDSDGCVYIASKTSFSGGGSGWAGDLEGNKGNWSYFEYCVQSCEVNEEPCFTFDQDVYSESITWTEAEDSIDDRTDIRNRYLSLLEDGAPLNGTFDPTIAGLLFDYMENPIGDFTTVYTVTDGECTDSATLTITVTEDDNFRNQG